MVLYWSYGFSQEVASSLWKHIPEAQFLIVANNPLSDDTPQRRESYAQAKDWGNIGDRFCDNWIDQYCQGEVDWFKERAVVIKPPHWMHHGTAIDFAVKWMTRNNIRRFVHIEPDCSISGREWYDNLFAQEANLVTTNIKNSNILTPSLWKVQTVKDLSFEYKPYRNEIWDENCPFCSKAVKWGYWDTGFKLCVELLKNHKVNLVKSPDFTHSHYGRDKIHSTANQ